MSVVNFMFASQIFLGISKLAGPLLAAIMTTNVEKTGRKITVTRFEPNEYIITVNFQ